MADTSLTQGNSTKGRILVVDTKPNSQEQTIAVAKAIASKPRLKILEYLIPKVASVSEISKALNMPIATASLHLNGLEDAGLVTSQTAPGKRGQQRIYARIYDTVVFNLPKSQQGHTQDRFTVQMPVGAFIDQRVVPTCGLAGIDSMIGTLDDPVSFYNPDRYHAQLIWLSHGFLEYRFPNPIYGKTDPTSFELSMEICSEAAPSAKEWPSDIFLEVNGKRLGIWTSPGDFADKRGSLTPMWWRDWNSQYGVLKVWRVNDDGSFVDGRKISSISVSALSLPDKPFISVRIGIDDDAVHKGGVNIFGQQFGNHAQDIVMQIDYKTGLHEADK
jgi:predicted transcriptional regulator